MEIDINENFCIRLTKIFNSIELVADNQRLAIAQRDGVFEIKVLEGVALQPGVEADAPRCECGIKKKCFCPSCDGIRD